MASSTILAQLKWLLWAFWQLPLFLARLATYAYLVDRVSTCDPVLARRKDTWARTGLTILACLAEVERVHLPLQSVINIALAAMQYEHQMGRRYHSLHARNQELQKAFLEDKAERESMQREEEEVEEAKREEERREEEERKHRREERFKRTHWARERRDCRKPMGGEFGGGWADGR